MGYLDYIKVRAGQVSGLTPIRIHGHTDNLDAGAMQSLGMGDDDTFTLPAAAAVHAIASTSANDAAAGTGARTVRITYLDANHAEQTETVTLNGQTEVDMVGSALRIQKIEVLTTGSGLVNAGVLWVGPTTATFTAGVPDTKTFYTEIGWNRSDCGQYTVPASCVLVLEELALTSRTATGKVVTARVEVRDATTGLWGVHAEHHIQDAASALPFRMSLPAETDVRIRAQASANDANLSATLSGTLINLAG